MIKDTIDNISQLIRRRSFAYNQVFNRANKYTNTVLQDLAKFCRAHESAFHKDDRLHAVMEGRREVWLRIEQYLNLTEIELIELHRIRNLSLEDKR